MAKPQKPAGSTKQPAAAQFDLIANARGSLGHAVEHLTGPDGNSPGNLKIAVREVAHVVELLLKEKLSRVHPAFAWVKIDEYPSVSARTIGTETAVSRLASICRIHFSKESKESIDTCRRLRNQIEHYAFTLEEKEAQGIIGRLLSFIFDFSKRHLDLDFEEEFRRDHRWAALVEIFEFWAAHREVVEKSLRDSRTDVVACPSCGAETFDWDAEECALCAHGEPVVQCDQCKDFFLESAVRTMEYDEGREVTLCERCESWEPDYDEGR